MEQAEAKKVACTYAYGTQPRPRTAPSPYHSFSPSHRRFASFATLHTVFSGKDTPQDRLGSAPGSPAQERRPSVTLKSTSLFPSPVTLPRRAATFRVMNKKRRSPSLQAILTPSFLSPVTSPTLPTFQAADNYFIPPVDSASSQPTSPITHATSPRASSPPSFLLDDDPFANLSAAPSEAQRVPQSPPPLDTNFKLQPRSPLTLDRKPSAPSSPPPLKSPTHSRASSKSFSSRAPVPASQKPAFAPKPSLPSLDTLSRINLVLPKKLRKGRVGAGLPFEPWDHPEDIPATTTKSRRPSTSPTSSPGTEPEPLSPTSPTSSDAQNLPSLAHSVSELLSSESPPSDEPTFIQASVTVTNGISNSVQVPSDQREAIGLFDPSSSAPSVQSLDFGNLASSWDGANPDGVNMEPNDEIARSCSRPQSYEIDGEGESRMEIIPSSSLSSSTIQADSKDDARPSPPVLHVNPLPATVGITSLGVVAGDDDIQDVTSAPAPLPTNSIPPPIEVNRHPQPHSAFEIDAVSIPSFDQNQEPEPEPILKPESDSGSDSELDLSYTTISPISPPSSSSLTSPLPSPPPPRSSSLGALSPGGSYQTDVSPSTSVHTHARSTSLGLKFLQSSGSFSSSASSAVAVSLGIGPTIDQQHQPKTAELSNIQGTLSHQDEAKALSLSSGFNQFENGRYGNQSQKHEDHQHVDGADGITERGMVIDDDDTDLGMARGHCDVGLGLAAPLDQETATNQGVIVRGDFYEPAEGGVDDLNNSSSLLSTHQQLSLPLPLPLQVFSSSEEVVDEYFSSSFEYPRSAFTASVGAADQYEDSHQYSSVEAIADWRDATYEARDTTILTTSASPTIATAVPLANRTSATSLVYFDAHSNHATSASPDSFIPSPLSLPSSPRTTHTDTDTIIPKDIIVDEDMLAYSSNMSSRVHGSSSSPLTSHASSSNATATATTRGRIPRNQNQLQERQWGDYDPHRDVAASSGVTVSANGYSRSNSGNSYGVGAPRDGAARGRSRGRVDDENRDVDNTVHHRATSRPRRPAAIASQLSSPSLPPPPPSSYSFLRPSSSSNNTATTRNSSTTNVTVTSSFSSEDDIDSVEEESESALSEEDDDVPLAKSIPTALSAQKSIRKQVREEKEKRRRERAGTTASAVSSSSKNGGEVRSRQTTLRPAGAGAGGQGAYSSSQEAAIHAASLSRSGSKSKSIGSGRQQQPVAGRQRTQTLPGHATSPFSVDDLTRKLQDVQQVTSTSTAAAGGRSHRRYPSGASVNADAYAAFTPPPPPAVPAVPAELWQQSTTTKTLRPQRSFHRPSPRTLATFDDQKSIPLPLPSATQVTQQQQQMLHRARSQGRLRDDYHAALKPSSFAEDVKGGLSVPPVPAVPRLSEEYNKRVGREPSVRSASTRPSMESNGGYISGPDGGGGRSGTGVERRSSSRRPSTADRDRTTSQQRPPVPPLPPSVAAEVAGKQTVPVQVTQQRVFIGDMQRYNVVEIEDGTSAGEVVSMLDSQGSLKGWIGSGEWMIWEVAHDFGMERPIRHYERLSDVQASWNKDKLVNMFVARLTTLGPLLARSAIPSSSPVHAGYVEWEVKRGKWSKRWLQLREHSLWISKRDNGKDEALLCSLSNFDAYHFSRPYKSPKPFAFAIKSTDKLSFFENTQDYKHVISCSEKDGKVWMEKILLARSYVLHQERNVLFNPKSYGGQPTVATNSAAALSRAPTSRRPTKPTQPLVTVANSNLFEPGSLLHRHG